MNSPNRIPLKIAVLGGGFAGVYCARALSRNLHRMGLERKDVAIVSDQNYLVFQPMLAEVAGGSLSPRHVVNPIRLLCRNIGVFKGQVKSVDLEKKEVLVDTGPHSNDLVLECEHIVFSLGAEIDLSRVPGMPEHALHMQNVGDAMILRATLISRIEEANTERRDEIRRRLLTFVVVGGGYSGVETAGEILDMVRGISKYYRRIDPAEFRVILVHSRDRVLNTLDSSLGDYAGLKLKDRGLELCLEERVKAVTATKVYLQSGDTIDTATVVSTVGNAPNRVIRELCDAGGLPHNRHWIQADEFLRVRDREGLWSAGDCAAVPMPGGEDGERCPQTAQFATRQGEKLAENLIRHFRGESPEPFTFTGLGELASIGHQCAVAKIGNFHFSGFLAWFMWRSIYLSKLPGLDRKLRVMIDWTLDLFFPRDINLLNPRYTRVFREAHLEAGDHLFNRGEPAFSLHVVREGEIQLRDEEGKTVRTLGPGDHFGERALVHGGGYLYDAVATESTELYSVGGDLVLPFFQSSRRLQRVLAKTTAQPSAEAELASICSKLPADLLSSPVGEVMRKDPASLRSDQSVDEALALFRERRYSIYPLVSEEGKLVGSLSREDFFDFIKRDDVDGDTRLDRIGITHLPACRPGDSVKTALEGMVRIGRHKCLVTEADNTLMGIFTVMDLFSAATSREMSG